MWDPGTYARYGGERSRPFFDLVSRIGATAPRTVTDLGCGPGNLTAALAVRWPDATVAGIDSSAEMIEAAAGTAGVTFSVGDVRDWVPGPDTDVVVSNAVLQWVPGHEELLRSWARALPSGAWLAFQVPGNFAAHSHDLLRELAATDAWAPKLDWKPRVDPVLDAAGYAGLLLAEGCTVDAWETSYLHLLPAAGTHPVLTWMEGTALRPVRARLGDAGWEAFRAELEPKLAAAYPVVHGVVPFEFRRVFCVAQTA
ncbi:trans-aconitate 2-methyltransferase [Longispora albida]|uniref:trans-aconitate 2-methyltransferase n=1 Tax=Longispora albida TaxID=203523 RepID=UPI00036490FC|nr:trans-aconitate 2-methyltransferase [Longispora albida]